MTPTDETARIWLNEGACTGIEHPQKPGRFVWNWALQVAVGDSIEHCQGLAIWDGGVEFKIKRELPVGSKIRIRRQTRDVEPWVEVDIVDSTQDKDGAFVVDGAFDALGETD